MTTTEETIESAKKVRLTCGLDSCDIEFVRYKSALKQNESGLYFCCAAHAAKAGVNRRSSEPVKCSLPGCEVTRWIRPSHRKDKNYCSKEHLSESQRVDRKIRGCVGCGCEFYVLPSDADTFHSRQCYDNWKRRQAYGKAFRTSDGYVTITMPDHPNAQPSSGRVMEHIKVMSDMIGRPLLPGENVHHKNGIKSDNVPSNLELWVTSQPSGQRVADIVEHAVTMLERYAPEKLEHNCFEDL